MGIDVGIVKFCHDSDDPAEEDNPQFLTKMLNPPRRAHRKVSSRRQLGGSLAAAWHQQQLQESMTHMLARLYERISNKRRDFLHKTSTYYSSRYDLIFLERLRVANKPDKEEPQACIKKDTGRKLVYYIQAYAAVQG